MSLYKITFSGTAYILADSEVDASERFGDGNWINKTIHTDKIEKIEGVDEDG